MSPATRFGLSKKRVHRVLDLAAQSPTSNNACFQPQRGEFSVIPVLNKIYSCVQPASIGPIVEGWIGEMMVLRSKDALAEDDPFEPIVYVRSCPVEKHRTEPADRSREKTAVRQLRCSVRELRAVCVMAILAVRRERRILFDC